MLSFQKILSTDNGQYLCLNVPMFESNYEEEETCKKLLFSLMWLIIPSDIFMHVFHILEKM